MLSRTFAYCPDVSQSNTFLMIGFGFLIVPRLASSLQNSEVPRRVGFGLCCCPEWTGSATMASPQQKNLFQETFLLWRSKSARLDDVLSFFPPLSALAIPQCYARQQLNPVLKNHFLSLIVFKIFSTSCILSGSSRDIGAAFIPSFLRVASFSFTSCVETMSLFVRNTCSS